LEQRAMQLPGGLQENFRFLVLDVQKQLEETLAFLRAPTQRQMERITGRDDYIDSLKSHIEEKVYSLLISSAMSRRDANLLRSVNTIATNLERIGDFAVNVVGQLQHLSDPAFINAYDYPPFFVETVEGLGTILPALQSQDISLAFRICQCEFHLDDLYKASFDRILAELAQSDRPGDLVTTVFIFRYLERMGDSLLNVGEAIIFALLGERLKIHQYQALRDSLASSGIETPISEVEFESIWGTRGGCRIGKVQEKAEGGNEAGAQRVIFKEGNAAKLASERDNIRRWEAVSPGLAPKVFGFQTQGSSASILLEYLEGCTFQEVLLNSESEVLDNALFLITEHLTMTWQATRQEKPCRADFLGQLRARLGDVHRVHPEFRGERQAICSLQVEPLESCLARLEEKTAELAAPFCTFIHGDFNVNNIIYDHNEQRVHFIDLHRSEDSDYVQDVSVFLLSNFRLPVQRSAFRDRINRVISDFRRFAQGFAEDKGDATFQARLGLGLIRSFVTSTRYELNTAFAREMYLRALYLIEKMEACRDRPWEEFVLPNEVLIY
jgi:phosphate uptake regulator/aminoglycoside phosphotransferase (APT) family kinase protein